MWCRYIWFDGIAIAFENATKKFSSKCVHIWVFAITFHVAFTFNEFGLKYFRIYMSDVHTERYEHTNSSFSRSIFSTFKRVPLRIETLKCALEKEGIMYVGESILANYMDFFTCLVHWNRWAFSFKMRSTFIVYTH